MDSKIDIPDSRPTNRPAELPLWRKAIPEARDRLQSLILVWIALPLLLLFASADIVDTLSNLTTKAFPHWLIGSILVSAAFAMLVWRLRSATPLAALAGGAICLNALELQNTGVDWAATAFPALIALFVLTFAATKFGRSRKESLGVAEGRKGRQASQVIANLGVAGWLAGGVSPGWSVACIAAIAEAAADTISSEIGQALGGSPRMITTGRTVSPGTDGAITLAGTACGIAAAAIVAGVAAGCGFLHGAEMPIAFATGCAGLIFDSLLGATAERRGWLGNDLVNLTSTVFAAALALLCTRMCAP